MKNAKFDTAFIDLEGTDLLSSPVIDYAKFRNAFLICNMVVITNFLIAGVKQPSVPVELEKDADENIIFNLTHYKVVIGSEEVTVSSVETADELKAEITTTGITNAKPLYFHPIYVRLSTAGEAKMLRASFFIINNSPTPFTYSTFTQYIKNLMDNGAYIQINGCIVEENAKAKNVFVAYKTTDYVILWNDDETNGSINYDDFVNNHAFSDGVNKIN